MSPPVPGVAWRQQAAEDPQKGQPLIIDGHVIPPGTQIGVSAYALHHNEKYFPSPFSFQPERWLNAAKDPTQAARMRSAFVPFSVGSRSCAGKAMAYLEASLVVAKALWSFDFEAAPGELGHVGGGGPGKGVGRERPDEYQLYDIFAASHSGPYLVFNPRHQQKC
jgi:cytochrome P450